MEKKTNADKPVSAGGKEYHLETGPGDLAAHCLLVGSPERATMIAETFFENAKNVGDHRGLRSYTGSYQGMPLSVVTTGMGSASTGIVLPEAARSGARRFIRVGSCSVLWERPKVGESAIAMYALRFDGASDNWAPLKHPVIDNPVRATREVTLALERAGRQLGLEFYTGIEATTTCFNEGQARPDDAGCIPPWQIERHEALIRKGVLLYSMESATIYVWCETHGHIYDPKNGIWAGSVNAIYGNRRTNEFGVAGDENAARIALQAMLLLNERHPLGGKK